MTTSALVVVTPATALPITVPDAKSQLRITHSYEDAHIENLIRAATSWAQSETRRIFLDTEVEVSIDRFPYRNESLRWTGSEFSKIRPYYPRARLQDRNARDGGIYLPGGNVIQVGDITYYDADDAQQTYTGPTSDVPGTDYQEDLTSEDEAWVMPAADADWPATKSARVNSVTIRYHAGFGTGGDDVPDAIRQAIRFRVADLFNIRDSNDAGSRSEFHKAAEHLLEPYRILVF